MNYFKESSWQRYGVAKQISLNYPSTLSHLLTSGLLVDYEPYVIIASAFKKNMGNNSYKNIRRTIKVWDLENYIQQGVSQFFIMSKAITPPFNLAQLANSNEELMLNGLICLQIYQRYRGIYTSPTLMMVDTIQNRTNNQVVEHGGYKEIFWSLRKTDIRSGFKQPQTKSRLKKAL